MILLIYTNNIYVTGKVYRVDRVGFAPSLQLVHSLPSIVIADVDLGIGNCTEIAVGDSPNWPVTYTSIHTSLCLNSM